jgi:signal transduction histidine kinase
MMRIIRKCIVLLMFLIPVVIVGQRDYFGIINYNTTNGLPQNSITGIAFDKNGFCWLSCEMGLIRFDGVNFKIFDNSNIQGLASIRFRRLIQTPDKEIFFINDKFQLVHIDTRSLSIASKPLVWNTQSQIESFIRKYPYNFYSLRKTIDSLQEKYPDNKGINISTNHLSEVYLKMGSTLFYLQNGQFEAISHSEKNFYDLQSIMIGDYQVLSNRGSTKFQVHYKGRLIPRFSTVSGPITTNKSFKAGKFTLVKGNDAGYLYCGNSLYKLTIDPSKGIISSLITSGLNANAIDIVYYHKDQQKYYVGSAVSGLYIIMPNLFHYYNINDEIVRRGFYSQLLLPDQSIICQKYVYRPNGTIDTLRNAGQMSISSFLDNKQNIYYGDENLLYKFNISSNIPKIIQRFASNTVYISAELNRPEIINVFTENSFYQLLNDAIIFQSGLKGINNNQITTALQTSSSNFIIGTENGLFMYDRSKDRLTRHILASRYIRYIYQDKEGRIWVTTYNKGIYLVDKDNVIQFPITPFDGLKKVHAFIDDGMGNFLLPSNNGLFKVSIQDLLDYAKDKSRPVRYMLYSMEDGLATNEFNGGCTPAYVWLRDGSLSMPSIMGLVRFNPHQLIQTLPGSKIFLSELAFNNNKNNYFKNNTLVLLQQYSDIKMDVTTPFYGNKNNLKLQYKIIGLNNEWQKVPDNGEIILSHIPHGEYEIVVSHFFESNQNVQEDLIINLKVIPPFHNSLWFYDLLIIFTILITYFIVWLRTRLLRRYNQNLKLKIEEQTRALQLTITKLEMSEQKLKESNKLKDQVTTMVLHDLRSPIRFVQLMAQQLDKNYNKMPINILEQRVAALKTSTAALNEFTEQFFTWAASQHSNFKVNKEMFDLMDLFLEIKHLYKDIVVINGNKITVEPCYIVVLSDRQILSTIVRNIVDNSNKITKKGKIRITGTVEMGGVCIYISDNGPGFQQDKLKQFIEGQSSSTNGGHGSIILNNLITLLHAKLEVFSEAGVGTIFKISLPQQS